ncbi:MAG TPA: PocR ligand-binding domain-containing protein [Bacteroidota bacterium]|nr:PocR ligand-binding domain-containing protein [Bacteroidota bacterium]
MSIQSLQTLVHGAPIAIGDLFKLDEIQRIQDEFALATGVASIITYPDGTPFTAPSNFTNLCNNIIRKTELGCANCFKSDAVIGRFNPAGPIVQPCLSGGLWDAGASITVGGTHVGNWLIGQVRDETQTEQKMRAYARSIGADEESFMKAFEDVPSMSRQRFEYIARALFTLANQLSTTAFQNLQQARYISERKAIEQNLAQEKQRLAVTLLSIGDGVITTDIDGRIVMLNKAAEEMTGWTTAEAAGRWLPEVFVIINELTREHCDNPVDRVLSTGNIIELANHTSLIAKDGRELLIADSGAPIRDNENRITGVVLVFRDMTEKQKLMDSMQRTQKLESLGILAGGIAHDFNNMLAGLFGYLDLCRENAVQQNTDHVLKYLDKALLVFERAKGLTQQLLTFAKGGSPIRKTRHLAPIIKHNAIFALSGSNVSCQFNVSDDLWLCDCDENQIGQVIDNIVINAKQAMPDGGMVKVSAVNTTSHMGRPGRYVKISIQDHGRGMPKELLPKIFDPFFSTKTTGHGLGLATVFSIVQRHDGWIEVESKPDRGTTFHIFLPASQQNEESDDVRASVRHRGEGRVLVMDDEEFILEILSLMLQGMGYSVVQAKDGTEAIAHFNEAIRSQQPFCATFLDLTIPGGVGGKEIAAMIRQTDPESIIIASSGYSEHPVIANPRENGFTDRICKPYRTDELMELMARVLPQ